MLKQGELPLVSALTLAKSTTLSRTDGTLASGGEVLPWSARVESGIIRVGGRAIGFGVSIPGCQSGASSAPASHASRPTQATEILRSLRGGEFRPLIGSILFQDVHVKGEREARRETACGICWQICRVLHLFVVSLVVGVVSVVAVLAMKESGMLISQ